MSLLLNEREVKSQRVVWLLGSRLVIQGRLVQWRQVRCVSKRRM